MITTSRTSWLLSLHIGCVTFVRLIECITIISITINDASYASYKICKCVNTCTFYIFVFGPKLETIKHSIILLLFYKCTCLISQRRHVWCAPLVREYVIDLLVALRGNGLYPFFFLTTGENLKASSFLERKISEWAIFNLLKLPWWPPSAPVRGSH